MTRTVLAEHIRKIAQVSTACSLVVALGMALVACGGDDDADDQLAPFDLTAVDDAIAAVDAERGGPQQYFEVTANAQVIRLFVEQDTGPAGGGTQVVTYAYLDGQLAESGRPRGAEGETFKAADLAFDPDSILDEVDDQAPEATVEEFSIVGTRAGPPRYAVFARSDAGGVLDITLSGDGEVLEVGPASLRS